MVDQVENTRVKLLERMGRAIFCGGWSCFVGAVIFTTTFTGLLLGQTSIPNQVTPGLTSSVASGSGTDSSTAPANKTDGNASFVIGNDDVLAISVWKEPDISRSIQVRSDGKISLPLMGEIQAAGRTPLQLEQDITVQLQNYIAKPKVTVMVEQVNSKKYNIVGQVGRPGSYPLAMASTVMDAIATAGGLRDFAKQKDIYILRQAPGGSKTRIGFNYKDYIKGKNLNQNVKLEPHDTIVVP
jgi:polysaccharide biosynthesis/export protein